MAMLISIDNGGTLTDACVIYGAKAFHAKSLTTPHDLTKCFVEVLKQVSERIYGEPRLDALLEEVDYIRYSTTQGTNAVVQRMGPRLGLIVRKGQKTAAFERNAHEKELFEALVADRVGEVDPTVSAEEFEASVISVINDLMSRGANRLVVSLGGKTLIEDEQKLKRITLLRYPRHLLGAVPLLFSHQLSDDHDDGRRTWSGLLNAFLHPAMERFLYSAEGVMRHHRARNPLLIFCNDGTSTRVAKTIAIKTWGSGPRGGMEGARAMAQHYNRKEVLTMDIGGTTTDVGAVHRGEVSERQHGALEDVQISFPLCEVDSLGVGGSSIFKVKAKKIDVGPESVGGAPGPACFGYGGTEATMTDAYLLFGLFDPESYFGGNLRLDPDRARVAITEKVAKPLGVELNEALVRMEEAYVARIVEAMKVLAQKPKEATLLAFGGAGPMSACRVAEGMGIKEIIVPRMAAVFSAFGIGFSDIAHSYNGALHDSSEGSFKKLLHRFEQSATRDMFAEGFSLSECHVDKSLSFVHNGEEAVRQLNGESKLPDGLQKASDVRLQYRATKEIPHFALKGVDTAKGKAAKSKKTRTLQLAEAGSAKLKATELPLYRLTDLAAGDWAAGPAIVEEEYFTCFVAQGWEFLINENHDIVLNKA